MVGRFLRLFLGLWAPALLVVAAAAVLMGGRELSPRRLADTINESRMRQVDEAWLRLLLSVTRTMMVLQSRPDPPTQADLTGLLTRHPELAVAMWTDARGGPDVVATRTGRRAVGAALRFHRPDGSVLQVRLDRDRLNAALLGKLPVDRESVYALLSYQGVVMAKVPPEAPLAVQLPEGYPHDLNRTERPASLLWYQERVHWLKEVKLAVLVRRQVQPGPRLRGLLAVFCLYAGVVALGAWLAAAAVTRPLRQLREGAQHIAQGETAHRIEVRHDDEVGDVARDLNVMAATVAQREHELKEKSLEAKRASELKTRFLANVSHELRTPLTAIIGYTDILRDGLQGPLTRGQAEVLERIRTQTAALLGHITDLLDITRIEAGRVELAVERVVLTECIEQAHAMVEPQLTAKGLRFVADLPEQHGESPLVVYADFQRLLQILGNLLANAVRFTDAGEVGVQVRAEGEMAEIKVWDSGVGIDEAHLPHVFDDYHQAEGAKPGGTGLGLSIVKRLVELHGGDIRVESRPGQGTACYVRIPKK